MTARKCAGCGRALPKSTGPFGPKCARKLHGAAPDARTAPPGTRLPRAPSQAATRPPTPPGQDPLPLEDP